MINIIQLYDSHHSIGFLEYIMFEQVNIYKFNFSN